MITPLFITVTFFSFLYFIMVMFFFIGWLRLKNTTNNTSQTTLHSKPFVSILIPVRNEAEHIQDCLNAIFKQNYPAHLFEILVIDDYSTDSTLELARQRGEKNLVVLDLMQYLGAGGEYYPNKKKAISLGVKNARGEIIITTDGDCTAGENWISTMVDYYLANTYKLITAPVLMKPAKYPIEIFQQMDVMNLVGITGATIRSNFPTMCNGANLMYEKKTFLEVEGFKGNNDVPTGDDIFLMQKINQIYPNSIGFLKNYEACVFTKPESSFRNFIAQRVRWVSKSSRFSDFKVAFVLYFAYFFNLILIVAALFALHRAEWSWLPLVVGVSTKLFADFIFNIPVTIFFKKWFMLLLLPFTEIFHVLYVVIIGVLSLTGNYKWKDRTVK